MEPWMRKRAELDQAKSDVLFVGNTEMLARTGTVRKRKEEKRE